MGKSFLNLLFMKFILNLSSDYLMMWRSRRIASRFFDPGHSGSQPEAATDGLMAELYSVAMQPTSFRHVCRPVVLTRTDIEPKLTEYVQLGDRELHPVSVMQFLLHGALLYSVASNQKTPASTSRS